MSRLTNDRLANAIREDGFIEMDMRDLKRIKQPSMEELYENLNRYERIEEELGCPLEVVFKALQNGIYFEESKSIGTSIYYHTLEYEFVIEWYKGKECYGYYLLSDYKKTWWLKKDKSE